MRIPQIFTLIHILPFFACLGKTKNPDFAMPDMEEHINVAFGDDLENGKVEEGTYPVLMTQQDMDTYNLVVGGVETVYPGK